jgi:2-polyprenyl-3-methyl-5-hydroxy-6-metoxy-1,4-benzoquinol methylase
MSAHDRDRWNERHAKCEPLSIAQPDEWLVEALQLIETTCGTTESRQRTLDVACGLGHNAIWLAQQGWRSDAVDISTHGLELARQCAAANDVDVCWIEADLDKWTPAANAQLACAQILRSRLFRYHEEWSGYSAISIPNQRLENPAT